jgi:hypothetical protein
MSINTNKIIFKRLVREYEFLTEDLKDVESVNSEIKDSFMQSLSDIDDDDILQTNELDSMSEEWAKNNKASDDLEKESNKHPEFKKLFRKVIVKCHPDKLSSDLPESKLNEFKEIYDDLIQANETEDWAKLIRCTLKLELEIPESAYDQIQSIEKSISNLKTKQEVIINSTAWLWYKTNDVESKSDILRNHLEYMSLLINKI